MALTKILCAIDFSPASERALRVAARISARTGADLVIVHAWYFPETRYAVETPFPPAIDDAWLDEAQDGLDATVRDAAGMGANAVGKLLTGVPWEEILGELQNDGYDLCVLATHGRTRFGRVLVGSNAEKIVRHAPCSVLAAREDGVDTRFTHVLVPTDFSEAALCALELAAQIVAPDGRITVVHVIEVPVPYTGRIPVADFARALDRRATAALEDTATRLRHLTQVPVTTLTRMGYAGTQTLAFLDEERTVDLVVMGTHGRKGLRRALVGSVAEKVMRHARCPVFVARKRL